MSGSRAIKTVYRPILIVADGGGLKIGHDADPDFLADSVNRQFHGIHP